ncbi:sugar ABC transporter permease [bacterium]|nr:sugar ABC transporter permease [bacterium]
MKRNPKKKVGPVVRDQQRTGVLFVLVPMLLFFAFAIYPMISTAYLSLTDYTFTKPPTFTGLANFQRLITDEVFRQAFKNTALFTLGVVPTGMVLSLFLALLLSQNIRGIAFFRAMFYLPVVTSTIASGVMWLWVYAPVSGIINQALGVIGLPPQQWLYNPKLALGAVMVMSVWKGVGYNMLIFLAAIKGIPSHLYEAAEIDGANFWSKLWKITIPLLKPASFFVFVTSIISSFQIFGSVFVMTKGGPGYETTTVVLQVYQNAFRYLRMGYASAEALVLFVVIFAVSLINWRFLRSDVEYY